MKAQSGSRGIALLLFNLSARWVGGQCNTSATLLPGQEPQYPLYTKKR